METSPRREEGDALISEDAEYSFDPKVLTAMEDNIRNVCVDYLELSNSLRKALSEVTSASVEQMKIFNEYSDDLLKNIEENMHQTEAFEKGFRDVDALNGQLDMQIMQVKALRGAVDRLETATRQVCDN